MVSIGWSVEGMPSSGWGVYASGLCAGGSSAWSGIGQGSVRGLEACWVSSLMSAKAALVDDEDAGRSSRRDDSLLQDLSRESDFDMVVAVIDNDVGIALRICVSACARL